MRFEVTQRGSSFFLIKKNINLTGVEEEWYAGDDKELAIRAMTKCNDNPGVLITSDDQCLRLVINGDIPEVFTIGYEGLVEPTAEEVKALFDQQPTFLLEPPRSDIRQEVWLKTYAHYLTQDGYNRYLASLEADSAVDHFDQKFTTKTEL